MRALLSGVPAFGLMLAAGTCNASEPLIEGRSISELKIGQAPPSFQRDRLLSRVLVTDENGDHYELLQVSVAGVPVNVELHDGRIWRMSVMQSGLRTADGVQVGDTLQSLIERNRSLQRAIGPGPSLVLFPENRCGISYIVDGELPKKLMNDLNAEIPEKFAQQKLDQILVTGCET